MIIDSLEIISSTVESCFGLNADVGLEDVLVGDDSVALLDSVLVVVAGSASVSDSGNIVLLDEKEEAAKVGSICLGEEILEDLSDRVSNSCKHA